MYTDATLKGLIPICFSCNKIRNDNGFPQRMENYIQDHSDAEFTHWLCPDCLEKISIKNDLNEQDT